MAVGHGDIGRLAIGALQREQRTDAAAPPALALEDVAAREGSRHHKRKNHSRGDAALVETRDPGTGDTEEQRHRDEVAAVAQPIGWIQGPAEAEQPGNLVGRGHRTDVAPQSRCDEEERGQQWHDDPEEHEQPCCRTYEKCYQHDEVAEMLPRRITCQTRNGTLVGNSV